MHRLLTCAAVLAAVLATGTPAALAGDGTDLVFRTGALEGLETGRALVYERTRHGAEAAEPGETTGGRLLVSRLAQATAKAPAARVTIEDPEGPARQIGPFPAGSEAGNPVLLAFLEFTARGVSEATGGSPFYIRNRIKDAFRAGGATETAEAETSAGTFEVTRIAYRPFLEDPNRAELGLFRELTITFEVTDAVPGGFVTMEASTGGARSVWLERIAYAGEAARAGAE